MKPQYIFLFFLLVSCSSSKHINKLVDKKTYSKEFKAELFKRCLFQNSTGEFHNNIATDLYQRLPPPPPYYIRSSKGLIDSISLVKEKPENIIENCLKLIQSRGTAKIINNEYKYRKINEVIE